MATAKSKQRLAAMLLGELADNIKANDCTIDEFVECINEVSQRIFPDYAVSVGYIPEDELNEILMEQDTPTELPENVPAKSKAPKAVKPPALD